MKLHHYLWAVAAACMLLPGCSNEDLSDHASAPVFIPGNRRKTMAHPIFRGSTLKTTTLPA